MGEANQPGCGAVKVIRGSNTDNVVTCCSAVFSGDVISLEEKCVTALQNVPIYHKIAIENIRCGETVYKYGQPIGVASAEIHAGEHVHVHNLESERGRGDRKG